MSGITSPFQDFSITGKQANTKNKTKTDADQAQFSEILSMQNRATEALLRTLNDEELKADQTVNPISSLSGLGISNTASNMSVNTAQSLTAASTSSESTANVASEISTQPLMPKTKAEKEGFDPNVSSETLNMI